MSVHSANSRYSARTLLSVVNQYVQQRSLRDLVSTRRAVRAIRSVVTDCEHTDEELAELVAISAVYAGKSVSFDLHDTRQPPTFAPHGEVAPL